MTLARNTSKKQQSAKRERSQPYKTIFVQGDVLEQPFSG